LAREGGLTVANGQVVPRWCQRLNTSVLVDLAEGQVVCPHFVREEAACKLEGKCDVLRLEEPDPGGPRLCG
jgi:hypothetical protein